MNLKKKLIAKTIRLNLILNRKYKFKRYDNSFIYLFEFLCFLKRFYGQKVLEMPGIEPGAFRMRNERSTTELHPHVVCKHLHFFTIFFN